MLRVCPMAGKEIRARVLAEIGAEFHVEAIGMITSSDRQALLR